MAITLAFYHGTTLKIDLQDTSSPYIHVAEGWIPQIATPTGDGSIPPYVTEAVPIYIKAANENGLATEIRKIHELQRFAAEYWVDSFRADPVTLRYKLDNESNPRHVLIKSIRLDLSDPMLSPPGSFDLLHGVLTIVRHPYWEIISQRVFPNTTPSAAAAVAYNYGSTHTPVGDVPARVNALAMRAGGHDIQTVWMGIRSANKHGATAVTNFLPIWECESGQVVNSTDVVQDTTSEVNGASPGGGSGIYLEITGTTDHDWDSSYGEAVMLTPTMAGYATASVDDAFGRFLVLGRFKVGADSVWDVYMTVGYLSTANRVNYDPVTVDDTDWQYYKLGTLAVPPGRDLQAIEANFLAATTEADWRLYLNAIRTSGSNQLMMDCICWVPTDEGFVHLIGASIDADSGADAVLGVGPSEKAQVMTIYDINTATVESVKYEFEHFYLPPAVGRIICVYSGTTSTLTDTLEFADTTHVASKYSERWLTLRGNV